MGGSSQTLTLHGRFRLIGMAEYWPLGLEDWDFWFRSLGLGLGFRGKGVGVWGLGLTLRMVHLGTSQDRRLDLKAP